ncbi:hypothetical protein FRC04_011617 [Tulasnella sp. 424]|nr:hypothetical protein FRC04_011617 [Tulasnella sp. 424]KAG8967199.1 hypothetical protein FRC05_002274 [Tulasnella sp. 425]
MSDSAPERLRLQSVLESPHAQREGNIVSLKPVGLPAYNPRDTDPRSAPEGHLPPIHRIPYETLLHIIHIYVRDSNYPVRDLSTLTLVCQHWRAIVEDTSSLWGRIDASEGLVALRKGLRMAKDAALHITYIQERSKVDQSAFAFFKTIGERIGQWRSLVVDAYIFLVEDYWAILKTTIPPRLEKLHLSGDCVYYGGTSFPESRILFGGAVAPPGLKDVRLTMIPIAVTPLKLACLKSLRLDSIHELSTSELLRILGDSPALETLALTFMPHLVSDTALSLPPRWTIRLPSLSQISLVHLPVPFTNLVLSVLEAPCLQKLRVGGGNTVEGIPSSQLLDEVLVHLVPTLKSLASTASAIGVTVIRESDYKIVVGGLEIEVDGVDSALLHFQDSFEWLCKHLGGNLKNLPFHLRIGTCKSSLAYLEWFTSRVAVTELSLWCSNGMTWEFEERTEEIELLLSHPIPSSSASWFLPDTEVLISNWVGERSNPEILEMIKRRHSANREQREGGSRVPKKFKEIRLSCGKDPVHEPLGPSVDLEFLKAVETAGEGADVYWEGKKWTSVGLEQ